MLRVVVDSSVWVDFFNKKNSVQIEHLKLLLRKNIEYSTVVIFPIIMQEILEGIENDKLFEVVKDNLYGLDFLPYEPFTFAVKSAGLYRKLRKKGITVRKANDCLKASLCIEYNLPLFHNEKDFDNIAKYTSLKIYKPTNDKD